MINLTHIYVVAANYGMRPDFYTEVVGSFSARRLAKEAVKQYGEKMISYRDAKPPGGLEIDSYPDCDHPHYKAWERWRARSDKGEDYNNCYIRKLSIDAECKGESQS